MTPFAQLRTFLETFRAGSVTRAAETLGITQPAASGHIRALEDQIGRALFEREARGVRPTAAAEELAGAISGAFDAIEGDYAIMRLRTEAIEGTILLAGPSEFMNTRMGAPIAALADVGLYARITLGGRDVIYAALEAGDADLAITASKPVTAELGSLPIYEEKLLPVASPNWIARALKRNATLAAALEQAPLSYDDGLHHVARLVEHEGFDPARLRPRVVVPDFRFVVDLAERGVGWAVVPDYLAEAAIARGALKPLKTERPTLTNQLYLVWRKSSLRHPRVSFARQKLLDLLGKRSTAAG